MCQAPSALFNVAWFWRKRIGMWSCEWRLRWSIFRLKARNPTMREPIAVSDPAGSVVLSTSFEFSHSNSRYQSPRPERLRCCSGRPSLGRQTSPEYSSLTNPSESLCGTPESVCSSEARWLNGYPGNISLNLTSAGKTSEECCLILSNKLSISQLSPWKPVQYLGYKLLFIPIYPAHT